MSKAKTPEQILENMVDEMPYKLGDQLKPYILEAMKKAVSEALRERDVAFTDWYLEIKETADANGLKFVKPPKEMYHVFVLAQQTKKL